MIFDTERPLTPTLSLKGRGDAAASAFKPIIRGRAGSAV